MSTPIHHSTLYSVIKSTARKRRFTSNISGSWGPVTRSSESGAGGPRDTAPSRGQAEGTPVIPTSALKSVAPDLADGREACTCQLHSGHAACQPEVSAPLRPPPRRIRQMQYTQSCLGPSYCPTMTGARNFRSYDSKHEFRTLGTFFRNPQTLLTTLSKVSPNQNPPV
jgi:hypothetical protein